MNEKRAYGSLMLAVCPFFACVNKADTNRDINKIPLDTSNAKGNVCRVEWVLPHQ